MMILAVLFAVLTLAPSAWAECTWVLWEATEKVGTESSWSPLGASENEKACEAWRQKQKVPFSTSGLTRRLIGETIVDEYSAPYPQLTVLRNYRCLPDTVDPRGPKGSGR